MKNLNDSPLLRRMIRLLLIALSISSSVEASARVLQQVVPICDASQCLLDGCRALVINSSNSSNESAETRTDPEAAFTCSGGFVGRADDDDDGRATAVAEDNNNTSSLNVTTASEVGAEARSGYMYQTYTCCPSGYDDVPTDVLETCSTQACTSPDGKGGYDCSADGFIHPLVCDQNSEYQHARKAPGGTIYSPYVCCIEAADGSNNTAMIVAASIWSALCGITSIACSILIAAILKSKKARAQGYNLYLVFLAVPDALFNIFSLGRNIVNLSGEQLSNPMGGTVHALEWFHTAANMWLNAFIVYQVHSMLLRSQKFVRTPPPTVKQVLWQVSAAYGFASLWAAWSLILLLQGSNIFTNTNAAWLTSKALMCGPPFLYTIAACIHVWWKQLLPNRGRTRVLSLYFLRVVIVFLLTWVPFLILVDVTYYKTQSLWMLGLAYYFSSLQGLLSVLVALGKPDVKRAVMNLLRCRRGDNFNQEESGFLGSRANRMGRSVLGSAFFTSTKSSAVRDSKSTALSQARFSVASGMDESSRRSLTQFAFNDSSRKSLNQLPFNESSRSLDDEEGQAAATPFGNESSASYDERATKVESEWKKEGPVEEQEPIDARGVPRVESSADAIKEDMPMEEDDV